MADKHHEAYHNAHHEAHHDVHREAHLRERVLPHTSNRDGNVEDQTLDLDARIMKTMGKQQQLSRNFGSVSITAFVITVTVSWQAMATTFQGGLLNGGPSTLVYGFILSFLGSLATATSLAELASMSPTSGGQYHWVAQLAPRRFAVILSWTCGWILAFSRVSTAASLAYVAGTIIQGLLVLGYESYTPERWHLTLLYWAVILLSVLINVLGHRVFPHVEIAALVLYVIFFFTLLVPLVYLAPQSSPTFVFRSFENSGGWSNDGVSWCIGLLTSTYALAGFDNACHMSEEVKNAAIVVPRGMISGTIIGGIFGFAFTIAILFSIGDLTAALSTSTNYPIIEIFKTATQSNRATNAMVAALISSMMFSHFGLTASASRVTWALARDKGLPFYSYFSHVDRHYLIPIRAIGLITVIMLVLGLINIASATAFNAIISITVLGEYASYILPIILVLTRRFSKKNIPFGPWTLGRLGLPINCFSLVFSSYVTIFMAFPPYRPVSAANMNYASASLGLAMMTGAVYWLTTARHVYTGPIREVIDDNNVNSTA